MYLNVGVTHPYRFAFFFLATFFGAFFPTALRPADDLVFFADFFDDFLAVAPLLATGNCFATIDAQGSSSIPGPAQNKLPIERFEDMSLVYATLTKR